MSKVTKERKLINMLKVLNKLLGACVGRAREKDKDDRRNWDFKQDVCLPEEGTDDENRHFEVCFRKWTVGENAKTTLREVCPTTSQKCPRASKA